MKQKIKKLLTFLDNLSLIKKFLLSYLVVFAIPVIIVASLFSNQIKQNIEREAINKSWQDSRQLKSDVLNNIEVCKNSLQMAVSTSNLIEGLNPDKDYTVPEMFSFRDKTLSNINNIVNYTTSIKNIRLFIVNKNMNELYPTIYHESKIADLPWYKELRKKDSQVLWRLDHPENDFLPESDVNDEVVSFYRQVKLYNTYIATAEVNMLSKKFFGNVYSNKENDNYFVYIMRSGGLEECWNKESKFFQKYEVNPLNLKGEIMSKTIAEEGSFRIKQRNLNFLVTYTYNRYLDIYIYQLVALNDINSGVRNISFISIAAIIIAIALFTLITYAITSALLKKLKVVMLYMRRVQNGEMSIEIPIQGNDEIGELSKHFNKMLNKVNELIVTVVKKEALTKDAEIQALHSQINAHFIYNVLEAIKMKAIIEFKYDIADALTDFGRLLRYNINWKNKFVTLDGEINHIKNYINLLNLRFNNTIQLNINIPDYLLAHEILKMLLQPVVENSIKHGLNDNGKEGTININAYNDDKYFYIEVRDDGVGIEENELVNLRKSIEQGIEYKSKSSTGNGIGLDNVNERIRLFYGQEFSLQVESKINEYTLVRIKLPYRL